MHNIHKTRHNKSLRLYIILILHTSIVHHASIVYALYSTTA